MVALKDNCCRFCTKVFCCSDCRESHESSKHPKPRCSLCVQDILPFNPKDDKTTDLFCHIVFNHLPLHCKLCGVKYTNNQELADAESCGWWPKQRALKEAQILAAREAESSPTFGLTSGLSKLEIICEENLPCTPEFTAGEGSSKPPLHTSDPGSLRRLKQLAQFDSPLELVRYTSTPVHGAQLPGAKATDSAGLPQLLFKTPSSSELSKYPFSSTVSTVGSAGSRTGSDTESRYYTGLTSIADSRFEREKETEADPSTWNTPGARKLQQQPDSNPPSAESSRRIERSILKSEAWSRVNESSRGDSIEKRVRFSDQCRAPENTVGMDHENSADNDVFFEARESLDELAASREVAEAKENPIAGGKDYGRDRNDHDERCLPSSSVECLNADKNYKVYKVEEGKVQNSPNSSVDEKENNKPTSSTSKSTSRVLMMLLVEQTDSKGLSALDLAPLIDTGLKKLEENSTGSVNNNSKIIKGSHETAADGSSGASASGTRRLSQVSSYSRTLKGSVSEDGARGSVRASIKDSFVISDRIECYTSTPARQQPSAVAPVAEPPDTMSLVAAKPDGIFSAMARVVRNALQKLPAVTTRNLSREPVPQIEHPSPENSLSAMEVLSIGSRSSSVVLTGNGGSCGLVASSQAIQLSNKRPRERLDSAEEPATSRDSPGSGGSGSSSNHQVVSSPVAKRPRGWYRIKGREPIARMRQITSPRGASREVQRFQQGSLTVGDTLMPLPSRAHQSTQTEN